MTAATGIADYLLSSPERIAGLNLQMMSAIGHSVFGKKRIDLFIASFDKGLLHRWWTEDGGWHAKWEPRGGRWGSKPAVVTSGDGRLYVFALGRNGDLHWTACQGNCDEPGLWHLQELGHPENDRLISHPTAAFDGGVVRVYARAESGALWTISMNTTFPFNSGWQRLADDRLPEWPQDRHPIFAPAAASWEVGRVDLFAARKIPPSGFENPQALDGELWHTWRDQNRAARSWRPPRTPGRRIPSGAQRITSSPEAVVWPKTESHPLGVLHVGACGVPHELLGPNFVLTSWLGRHWESGRPIYVRDAVSSATLASWGQPRLDLFYVGVVPGGNFFAGPWHAVHLWTTNLRDWSTDNTSLGAYPVQYFPGA